jgi:thymidine kinase
MFIEPNLSGERRGWIEVICGSMFSGKTEELIRRLKRAKIANLKVEIYKPAIDVRYDQTILLLAQDVDVVGIDEAQFFDAEIMHVCETLALRGIRVIVAGLDMDYLGKPFGQMPNLLAIADYITKLHAICMKCGNIANVSYRKVGGENQVMLGEKETYEPRCRKCYHDTNQQG